MLSSSVLRIKPSPTLAFSAQAKALKAQGLDIIDLSAGEPDLLPPSAAIEAAHQAINAGYHYYTQVDGLPSLKEAIIGKFLSDQELTYIPSQIVVSAGAKSLIFHAFLATLNPGDEVIIPTPSWVSYQDMVLFANAQPICVPCSSHQNFKLLAEDLKKTLTPQTKWLVLNSPNNPTGSVYSAEELQALGEVLRDYPRVLILCDDIYEIFTYDNRSFCTLLQVAPFLKERTLVVNGISKSYAMTGWRIGYGGGPEKLMRAIATLQSQSTSSPCAVSQKAAEAALRDTSTWKEDTRTIFQTRRDALVEDLKKIGLTCTRPEGAFYVYVNCDMLLGKKTPQGQPLERDENVAAYFLEAAQVCVVPGQAFGFSPYLRFSYTLSPDILTEATRRLHKAIQELV